MQIEIKTKKMLTWNFNFNKKLFDYQKTISRSVFIKCVYKIVVQWRVHLYNPPKRSHWNITWPNVFTNVSCCELSFYQITFRVKRQHLQVIQVLFQINCSRMNNAVGDVIDFHWKEHIYPVHHKHDVIKTVVWYKILLTIKQDANYHHRLIWI